MSEPLAVAGGPLRTSMPRHIMAIVDDLFFAAKIRGTAEQVGVTTSFPRTVEAVVEGLAQKEPSLILCDLHSQKIDPIELVRNLKADEKTRGIPTLGFFSHVQMELQRTAKEAGFDRVLPRSAFAEQLLEILTGS